MTAEETSACTSHRGENAIMNKILSVLSVFAVKISNREGAKYAKKYGSYLRHVA
jgi:hypothetical protein